MRVELCETCKKPTTERVLRRYRSKTLGLMSVTMDGVREWRCSKHGQQGIIFPAMGRMLDAVGRALLKDRHILTKEEYRWMDKHLRSLCGRGAKTLQIHIKYDPKTNEWA